MLHAERLTNGAQVPTLVLETERRRARDDAEAAHARQRVEYFNRDSVGKELLIGIGRQVVERQHGHRVRGGSLHDAAEDACGGDDDRGDANQRRHGHPSRRPPAGDGRCRNCGCRADIGIDTLHGRRQAIAPLGDRVDVSRAVVAVPEGLPQLPDGEVHGAVAHRDVFPDRRHQRIDGDDGAVGLSQGDQHVHGARLEPRRAHVALDQVPGRDDGPGPNAEAWRVVHVIPRVILSRA